MHDNDISGDIEPTHEPASVSDAPRVDRAAAFAAGAGGIPRKTVFVFLAALVVLGFGGIVADHFFSGPDGNPTTVTTVGTFPPPLQTPTTSAQVAENPGDSSQLPASLTALMGLEKTPSKTAPGISLTDQHGATLTLADLRGKIVVLSFFDAACDDICLVLATELSEAYSDLGPDVSHVAMLTVNTDPLELNAGSATPAEAAAGISSLPDWHFLTGSLAQLDAVWKSYGVTVEVQRKTGLVSHNDTLYFIDASGRLRLRATPFANENTSRVFSLPIATETAFATGIADQVRNLQGGAG